MCAQLDRVTQLDGGYTAGWGSGTRLPQPCFSPLRQAAAGSRARRPCPLREQGQARPPPAMTHGRSWLPAPSHAPRAVPVTLARPHRHRGKSSRRLPIPHAEGWQHRGQPRHSMAPSTPRERAPQLRGLSWGPRPCSTPGRAGQPPLCPGTARWRVLARDGAIRTRSSRATAAALLPQHKVLPLPTAPRLRPEPSPRHPTGRRTVTLRPATPGKGRAAFAAAASPAGRVFLAAAIRVAIRAGRN